MADQPNPLLPTGLTEPSQPLAEAQPVHRRHNGLRSASVRFAVLYGLVFGVSTIVLAASLRYSTLGLLSRQTEVAIRADGAGLVNHYRTGGIPSVVLALRNRIRENPDESAIYLLVDPLGNRIIGNLSSWPQAVAQDNVLYSVPIEHFHKKSAAQLRAYALPDGDQLLVGRDIEMQVKLRRILRDAMIWTLAAMVGLGIIGALVVRGLFARSIGDISLVTRAIARGDLNQRVRRDYTGDEFDIMAETINDMLDRIARLMDGVREVSNAIAHDLRTPIARARTRLEFAASHSVDADELRAAIERATGELDGVVRVFQALLRIAEIEAGARRSAFAACDLAPVVSGLAEFYEAAAEERGITLEASCPASLDMVGDCDMVQQAIANLLDNAIKFAPDGGVVRLAARVDATSIEIHVSDNGPGIPLADRARATERFYRSEAARNTPGTGLGLALVSAIAQLHNGRLRLEDNQPGLRAVLILPRDHPKQALTMRARLRSVTRLKTPHT